MYAIVDKIAVGIILALAGLYVWRRFFRSQGSGTTQGGCGCCSQDCPSRNLSQDKLSSKDSLT